MVTANTAMILPRKTQEGLLQYHHQCCNLQSQNWNLRDQMRRQDLAYIRENDLTTEQWRARISNQMGDATKFQNTVVPVVMPMVESATTYQASVFLTGHPIFGV